MNQFNTVILVTGTPGVGKTDFSNLMSKRLELKVLNLTSFLVNRGLTAEYDFKGDTYTVDLTKAESEVNKYLRVSGKMIVEGHLSHLLVSESLVSQVFILRCHPTILRKRLDKRGYIREKMRENLTAEILDSCLIETVKKFPAEKICEIDLTNMSLSGAVAYGIRILKGQEKPCFGFVDWIQEIQKEESLIETMKFLL